MNNAGQVVVASTSGILLYSQGKWISINPLSNALGTYAAYMPVNDLGQVLGAVAVDGYRMNAFYSGGIITPIGSLYVPSKQRPRFPEVSISVRIYTPSPSYNASFSSSAGSSFGKADNNRGEAINNAGQIVGSSNINADGGSRAILYSEGLLHDLGTLGGTYSHARDINDAGQIVGSSTTETGSSHAFLYANGVMRDLGVLPNGTYSTATAINEAGDIVGYGDFGQSTSSANPLHAFLHTGNTMYDLGTLGGASSKPVAINDSGYIIGNSDTANGDSHAFLRPPGIGKSMINLGDLALETEPMTGSEAIAINSAAQVVGTYYTGGKPSSFGLPSIVLGNDYTAVQSSSIILAGGKPARSTPFLHVDGVTYNLNDVFADQLGDGVTPGFTELVSVKTINNLGQITGTGLYFDGEKTIVLTYLATLAGPADLGAPEITQQPAPVTKTVEWGARVTYQASANGGAGDGIRSWQWCKNGQPISGATTSTLTIAQSREEDSGDYTVVVFGHGGITTSQAVTLVVKPHPQAPVIISTSELIIGQVNQSVALSVETSGASPMSYQWSKWGGDALTGATATSPKLVLPRAAKSDSDTYAIRIKNQYGEIESGPITLLVTDAPQEETITLGQTAEFSSTVTTEGKTSDLSFQWYQNAIPVANATEATFTLTDVRKEDAGTYHLCVTDKNGIALSGTITLKFKDASIPTTQQPDPTAILSGKTITLKAPVPAKGEKKTTYQWFKNDQPIAGATKSTLKIKPTDNAAYTVKITKSDGMTTSETTQISVLEPVKITAQPSPAIREAIAGESVTFSVTATGTRPLTYEWLRNGKPIPAAPNASSITVEADTAIAGKYSVRITQGSDAKGRPQGKVTSKSATLKVSVPPAIVSQPDTSLVVIAKKTLKLSAKVTGTAKLTYQWFKDGEPLARATKSTYSAKATTAHAGVYTVKIKNGVGEITSDPITVTVLIPPVITFFNTGTIWIDPATGLTDAAVPAELSVTAEGTGPLNYEWRKNGERISNAPNTPTLRLATDVVGEALAGNYSVVVTGSAGKATTKTVKVKILAKTN